jgi:hypothetical protein
LPGIVKGGSPDEGSSGISPPAVRKARPFSPLDSSYRTIVPFRGKPYPFPESAMMKNPSILTPRSDIMKVTVSDFFAKA